MRTRLALALVVLLGGLGLALTTDEIVRNIYNDTTKAITTSTSASAAGTTPATIDTSFTGQTADFTVEAAATNLRILGWTIRESAVTAAAATVVVRHDADGTCDSTAAIAFLELAANESVQMWYGDRGLAVPSGVCADVLAGTLDLNIYRIVEAAP